MAEANQRGLKHLWLSRRVSEDGVRASVVQNKFDLFRRKSQSFASTRDTNSSPAINIINKFNNAMQNGIDWLGYVAFNGLSKCK